MMYLTVVLIAWVVLFAAFTKARETNMRIIGGAKAEPGQFPFLAGVFSTFPTGVYFSGGSIISERFVLTAAHSVYDAQSIDIKVGAHHILETEESQDIVAIERVIIHEEFVFSNTYVNDIALLLLARALEFNDRIKPIRLPRYSDDYDDFNNEVALVAGWGMISDSEPVISEDLKWAEVRTLREIDCNRWWLGLIFKTNICTSKVDGKTPCDGDDGGPLVVIQETQVKQIGIASFGYVAGCESSYPYVYTKVPEYLAWLELHSGIEILP